ncbi:hypothetical protein CHARACLAT_030385, partial [Characodon lateralis]|nr:hypothetical protein [Characodon lateralis]
MIRLLLRKHLPSITKLPCKFQTTRRWIEGYCFRQRLNHKSKQKWRHRATSLCSARRNFIYVLNKHQCFAGRSVFINDTRIQEHKNKGCIEPKDCFEDSHTYGKFRYVLRVRCCNEELCNTQIP